MLYEGIFGTALYQQTYECWYDVFASLPDFVFLPQLGVNCGAPPLTDHGAYVDYLGQVVMEMITMLVITLRLRQIFVILLKI